MSLIVLIVAGGIVGWLAGIVTRTAARQGIVTNVLVGIVGSFVGNGLFGALFAGSRSLASWPPSPGAWLAAFAGAVLLIALLKLYVRRRARRPI